MLKGEKKILVINLKYIGDSVWMIPFIRNLKMNIPDSEISVLVNKGCETLLHLVPEVSEVICLDREEVKGGWGYFRFLRFMLDIRRRGFEAVFVLSYSDRPSIIAYASGARARLGFRTGKWWRDGLFTEKFKWDPAKCPHMVQFYLQALTDSGLQIYDRTLRIEVPDREINKVSNRFGIQGQREAIVVHPGARTGLRQWGSGKFADVINLLADRYRIYLIGGPGEEDIIREITDRLNRPPDIVSASLNLLEFAALCKQSDLFLGNDSAPIHIAAAVGLFVIGLYGPTISKYCGPWTERKFLFDESRLDCRPCRQDGCRNERFKGCISSIEPAAVAAKICEILS